MIILDTDHLSIFERRESAEARRLTERLSHFAPEDVATTVISYEEQTRGWMAYISRAKSIDQQVRAYQKLLGHLDVFREIPVLPFDEASATNYQRLRAMRLGVATMDLKIASIALAYQATLLTRNTSDFRNVPDLIIEDWTV